MVNEPRLMPMYGIRDWNSVRALTKSVDGCSSWAAWSIELLVVIYVYKSRGPVKFFRRHFCYPFFGVLLGVACRYNDVNGFIIVVRKHLAAITDC